ncbi:MAG TPA: winged helix-turn-helix transcriptional regulator [Tissierellaceae bacterium]|nr:winged helix-turn-helix transcriptional regulator [Tissierellaceae bacterium]
MNLEKNNSFFIPTNQYKELLVLEAIHENPNITQKQLGETIGSSASMINTYIDECEINGYLKREYKSSKNVLYHITKNGIKRKKYLNISYLEELVGLRKLAKRGIEKFLKDVVKQGYKNIILYGAGDVAEIVLGVIHGGTVKGLNIVAVADDDPEKRGKMILEHSIISKIDVEKHEYDGILISSYAYEETIKEQLIRSGFEKGKIIQFFG